MSQNRAKCVLRLAMVRFGMLYQENMRLAMGKARCSTEVMKRTVSEKHPAFKMMAIKIITSRSVCMWNNNRSGLRSYRSTESERRPGDGRSGCQASKERNGKGKKMRRQEGKAHQEQGT